ncbi:MAG: glycosyltransferase family 4 protein [Elusimicrobia bacterium]|nr:glycosyltransferase family 4 protein [Elusimicrobiota bacterium]
MVKVWIPVLFPVAAFLGLISFVDDYISLSVAIRLAAQFLAASFFVTIGFSDIELWVRCLSILGLIWGMNLFNFMDGADGLATGMALIGFGAYALAAQTEGDRDLALVSLLVSGSAGGFLVFNWPPAKAFLGDAGSIPLGFLAGAIGVEGVRRGVWGWEFPFMVFLPFIGDATITLFRRIFRGEIPWQAHRSHYYQRLIQTGWNHRTLVLWAYALMVVCAVAALAFPNLSRSGQAVVFSGSVLVGISVACHIDSRWNKFIRGAK